MSEPSMATYSPSGLPLPLDPHSPSPSPSPSQQFNLQLRESISPGTPSPNFHVPGPSSRFNQRERTRPQIHIRHRSYIPIGPVLSTEKRAHERAQSYAGKSPSGIPSPVVPNGSDYCGRSPLSRLPSFPGEVEERRTMASSTSSLNGPPVTPAKASHYRRRSSLLQDSPFSDYFTDDARSLESQSTPTSETQHLLVRLNKLQSRLMRGENAPEMLNMIGRRIDEIEGEVEDLHSQTGLPIEIEDEMFTEMEREVLLSSRPGSKRQRNRSNPLGIDGISEDCEENGDVTNWDKARQDKLLIEAQTALHFLSKAQEQLRQRHQELVNLNEEHSLDMEEKEMEVERLRSENESLKSDLGFDHSELLFLELQLKSLEVECEDPMYHPKLERLQRQMENWRDDWQDVEARFKTRRSRYGVAAQGDKSIRSSSAGAEQEDDPEDWKVEVKKHGTKRVNSLTIRRVSRESEKDQHLEETEELPTPTKPRAADQDSTPRPATAPDKLQQHIQHNSNSNGNTDTKPTKTKPTTATATQSTTPTYTSQSTQTTPPPSPTLTTTPIPLSEALGLNNGPFSPSVDECAITTSPSSVADEDSDASDEEEDEEPQPVIDARREQKRNALRELWSGLTDWAGMGDDEEW